MRMTRVNITVPDEVLGRAKAAGLNISQLAAAALAQELDRREKVAGLDRYLGELEAELGPVPADQQRAAQDWVDAAFGPMDASRAVNPARSG